MAFTISDYLIDQTDIDWATALSNWSWLLPPEVSVWLINRFADLFLVLSDGTVHMLDVGGGTLTKVAENCDDFCEKIKDDDAANEWLMISLTDQMVATGIELQPGECYGFKQPPIVGGPYTIDNIIPVAFLDHLGAYGSIHDQLQDVPEGAQIVFTSQLE